MRHVSFADFDQAVRRMSPGDADTLYDYAHDMERRLEAARGALYDIQSHHVEINNRIRRPLDESKTLLMVRAGLADSGGGGE